MIVGQPSHSLENIKIYYVQNHQINPSLKSYKQNRISTIDMDDYNWLSNCGGNKDGYIKYIANHIKPKAKFTDIIISRSWVKQNSTHSIENNNSTCDQYIMRLSYHIFIFWFLVHHFGLIHSYTLVMFIIWGCIHT